MKRKCLWCGHEFHPWGETAKYCCPDHYFRDVSEQTSRRRWEYAVEAWKKYPYLVDAKGKRHRYPKPKLDDY